MESIKKLIQYFLKLNEIGKSVGKSLESLSLSKTPKDVKNMTVEELFDYVDSTGDDNGFIGLKEFMTLAKKLGNPITKHRAKEIFSKIKQHTANPESTELDFDEFKQAF